MGHLDRRPQPDRGRRAWATTSVFRFDFGRDGCAGIDGWYVDNVKVTVCDEVVTTKSGSTTAAKAQKKVRFTKDFKVRTQVRRNAGGTAAGIVKVYFKGKQVARGRLDNHGRVKVLVKRNIGPGKRVLVVKYRGNATTRPSQDAVKIRVLRRR